MSPDQCNILNWPSQTYMCKYWSCSLKFNILWRISIASWSRSYWDACRGAVSCNFSRFFEFTFSIQNPNARICRQAPFPLMVFRSNSKFDQNFEYSSLKYAQSIITKLCTRHDSDTVVTCAKCCCDRWSIFQTSALQIVIKFRIQSKYR